MSGRFAVWQEKRSGTCSLVPSDREHPAAELVGCGGSYNSWAMNDDPKMACSGRYLATLASPSIM